jgi:hypothetical protein
MSFDPTTWTTPTAASPTPSRRTRTALVIALVLALLAATLVAVGVRSALDAETASGPSASGADVDGLDSQQAAATSAGHDPSVNVDAEDVQVLEVDLVAGSSSAGGGAGTGPVPVDGHAHTDADPCAGLPAGRALLVAPNPLVLPADTMGGTLHLTNCSGQPVAWTGHTVPKVTLDPAGDTLAPGATAELGFTIDKAALDPGAFTFKVKVSEPGANTYVDVHAFKGLLNPAIPQLPGGPQLQPAPGSGGCALQCITKAWLTPNALNPNVSLEVVTTVPARHKVWVSTQAPVMTDGVPTFPGVAPIATNNSPTTTWTTPLAPLSASTTYHIVVEATDEHDNRAHQAGQFTTITPAGGPGGLAPTGQHGGCAAQCITTAWITQPQPGADPSIEVKTNVPATVRVYLSEQAPAIAPGGTPQPAGAPVASTGANLTSNWTATFADLKSDTTYHVVVEAHDADGGRSYRVGQFHTLDHTIDLFVVFHQIHVIEDGDSGKNNAGELSFRIGVDGTKIAETPERKIHSGTTVTLKGPGRASGVGHLVTGVTGYLPALSVQGFERDGDAKIEFCTMGPGILFAGWGHLPNCDLTFNTAGAGIHTVDGFDDLPSCAPFVAAGANPLHKCLVLETADRGSGFPHFTALVSLHVVE